MSVIEGKVLEHSRTDHFEKLVQAEQTISELHKVRIDAFR